MVSTLIQYGFYKQREDVFEMLDPLVNIRDSQEDTATPVPCKTTVTEHGGRRYGALLGVRELAHIGLAHTYLGK